MVANHDPCAVLVLGQVFGGKRVKRMYGAALRLAAVILVLLGSVGWVVTSASAQEGPAVAEASPVAPLPDDGSAGNEDLSSRNVLSAEADEVQIRITAQVCMNDARAGETDFIFSAGIQDAAVGDICSTFVTYESTEVEVILTGPENYNFPFSNTIWDYFMVVPGTYTVSLVSTTGHTIDSSMDGTVTIAPDTYNQQVIITYYRSSLDVVQDGTLYLYGQMTDCIDASREGDLDVFSEGYVRPADTASECVATLGAGQTSLILSGVPAAGGTYGPVTISLEYTGQFSWESEIPAGDYILTDSQTGAVSGTFRLTSYDSGASAYVQVHVVRYLAELPALLPVVNVTTWMCESADRAGETDILLTEIYAQGETCRVQDLTAPIDYTLTSQDDGTTYHTTLQPGQYYWGNMFAGVQPGTYILSEDGTSAASLPFVVESGNEYYLVIVHYGPVTSSPGEPTGEGTAFIYGDLYYCTSDTRAGEVDFIMLYHNFSDLSSSSIGDCSADQVALGQLVLEVYADQAGTTLIDTYYSINSYDFWFPDIETPAYVRIGYKTSILSEDVIWSDIVPVSSGDNMNFSVFAYLAAPTGMVPLDVYKEYCYDPERNNQTEFILETYKDYAAAATLECRPAEASDGPIHVTVTNQETGDAITVTLEGEGREIGVVPAGIYVASEDAAGYAATSEPFTLDAESVWNTIHIRNYTDEPIEHDQTRDEFYFGLGAFDCINDARAGESDFVTTSYFDANAEPVQQCVNPAYGTYEFELIDASDVDSVAATAIYPMVEDDEGGYFYLETDERLPAGWYIVRETTTGATSDPIEMAADFVNVSFYNYLAAPTPTPTVTATPSATAPGEPTATIPDSGKPIPPPRATATTAAGGSNGGNANAGDGTGNGSGGSGITTLPSTGQGASDSGNTGMFLLLGLALALLLGAASITRRMRSR